MILRNYLGLLKKKAIAGDELSEELRNWLQWGWDKADWYDPLIDKDDDLLKGVDKITLAL